MTVAFMSDGLFCTCSSDIVFEESECILKTGYGDFFVCSVCTSEKLNAYSEGSVAINVFTYRFIVVGIGATHNKVGGDD